MRAKLSIASSALAAMVWAVSNVGAAHLLSPPVNGEASARPVASAALPLPARFKLQKDLGLLLRVWLDGRGPYIFAIDTGAGLNLITQAVADAGLKVRTSTPTLVGGLTSTTISSNREALISRMAVGDPNNFLPSQKTALIAPSLAPGVDGILDPTESYSPFGYAIDIPNQQIEAVDINIHPLRRRQPLIKGAVVPWLTIGGSNRPFVRLGDGRIALLDTGSRFGLAVSERDAVIIGNRGRPNTEGTRDIGGGTIFSRRVSPRTISIGDLILRGVPTDILSRVHDDAPVILGRDALYPFKITFDPRGRLIEFVTAANND